MKLRSKVPAQRMLRGPIDTSDGAFVQTDYNLSVSSTPDRSLKPCDECFGRGQFQSLSRDAVLSDPALLGRLPPLLPGFNPSVGIRCFQTALAVQGGRIHAGAQYHEKAEVLPHYCCAITTSWIHPVPPLLALRAPQSELPFGTIQPWSAGPNLLDSARYAAETPRCAVPPCRIERERLRITRRVLHRSQTDSVKKESNNEYVSLLRLG